MNQYSGNKHWELWSTTNQGHSTSIFGLTAANIKRKGIHTGNSW